MKYRCPKCNKIFVRDGRLKPHKGKSYISYCEEYGVNVRVRRTR